MASKPSKEETQRQSKNKNASPGTVRQPDSEEKDSALEVTSKTKGSSRNRNPKEKDSHGDEQPRKDNVATLECSEENSSGEEAGSEDLGVNKQNEETPGNDGAKGKSSSPQRTEFEQGEASEGIGKPCTEIGGHENLNMSLDYEDSPNTSMVNVFKPLHVPGNNPRVTQDKTEMDDQRSDSSGSIVVLNDIDTEEHAEIKGDSEDDETKEKEESGAVETDMSGAGQTYVEPFGNMVSDDSSNNKKPNLNEAAQFHVTEVFGKSFLNDVKGNKSLLPQEIRCGPNLCIDQNFIKDEDDKLFEIVKFENGQFYFKGISEGKIANETNVGDETQTVSSLTTTDSVVNASVKRDGAGVVAMERIKSSRELHGSSMRQKLADDKIMPEHGHKSLVDAHSFTDNNLDQTKIKQTSDEECRSNNCNDSNSPAHSTVNDVEGSSTQSGRTDVDVDAYNPTDRPLKNVSGVGCQAAAASDHSTSKDMMLVSVVVWCTDERGQSKPVPKKVEADLETKMKLMFAVKQRALFTKKTQKVQDIMNVEVDYKDDSFNVTGLKFGENIDKVLDALITTFLDTLVYNEVPVAGLDGQEICSNIMKSEFGQNGNIYSHFNLDKNLVCYVYEEKFKKQVEEYIFSCVKEMTKEREASKPILAQIMLSIVFSEVFLADKMKDKFKRCYPQVKLEVEISAAEDCTKVWLSGAKKNVEAAKLWITAEYENKFVFNCCGLSEVKLGDEFLEIIEIDELLEIVERKCLLLKEENSNLSFYINSKTKRITICTTEQKSADSAIISLKKCLKKAEFDTDDISNSDKNQHFKCFAKGLEQNHCKVTYKENIVHIVGLKEDIKSAENCFHEILKEIEAINTAKGAEYQPKSDDSKTSQHTAQSIEKKLEHTTHKSWKCFNGHAVMVARAWAEEFWEEVFVDFEVHGKADQADFQPEFQQIPEAMYKVSLKIPQWHGGQGKEKHRVAEQFKRLIRLMVEKDVSKAAVQMHSYGNWPNNILMKQILKPLCEQQTVRMKTLFCCASDDDYQSVCGVCREVFGEEHKEITSGSTDPTSQALVTKVVKSKLDEYQVDVIVNSVDSYLDLSYGAVSKALSVRAGSELQNEVKRLHPYKMDDWEILVTQGHRLKCKHVLHGVLPPANYEVQKKVQKLQEFTLSCLIKAAALQCKSIAFPALGTGNLDYKPEDVAEAMFSAVDDFMVTYRGSSLKEVHFVLYYKDTEVIQSFQHQQKLRGPENISTEVRVDKVSIKAQLGTVAKLRTDCVIYLWEKEHLKSGLTSMAKIRKLLVCHNRNYSVTSGQKSNRDIPNVHDLALQELTNEKPSTILWFPVLLDIAHQRRAESCKLIGGNETRVTFVVDEITNLLLPKFPELNRQSKMPRKKRKRTVEGLQSKNKRQRGASMDLTGKPIWVNIIIKGVHVLWPVKLVSEAKDNYVVYVKSDNEQLLIKKTVSNAQPFPGNNFEQLKTEAIAYFKTKHLKNTEMCFMVDIKWALSEVAGSGGGSSGERASSPKRSKYSHGQEMRQDDDSKNTDDSRNSSDNLDDSFLDETYQPNSKWALSEVAGSGGGSSGERASSPKRSKYSHGQEMRQDDDSKNTDDSRNSSDNLDDSFLDETYQPNSKWALSEVAGSGGGSSGERASSPKRSKYSHGQEMRQDDDSKNTDDSRNSSDNLDDSFLDETYQPNSEDRDGSSTNDEHSEGFITTSTSHVLIPDSSSEGEMSDTFPMLTQEVLGARQIAVQDTDYEEKLKEEDILRDPVNPDIYIKRVLKADISNCGRIKKHDRVYNSYQYCGACKLKVSNLAQHLTRHVQSGHVHEAVTDIKAIREEQDKKLRKNLLKSLRAKFNHDFNMVTIEKGKGEILLERRPLNNFRLKDYGPCPQCFLWVAKKLLKKHERTCISRQPGVSRSIGDLTTQSECLSKQLKPIATDRLIKEVFEKMYTDKISVVVKGDTLITQLGNQWLEKNVGNVLKRGVYTSQILRLVGRFLVNMRKIVPIPEIPEPSVWDYLKPEYFQYIVRASILTASPMEENDDKLQSPSNAIKMGYDLKRLLNGKIGLSIMSKDAKSEADAEKLLKLMDIYWGSRVSKAARVILEERKYYAEKMLPLPADIVDLNNYLKDRISELDYLQMDKSNFKHIAQLVEAKLVLYNRRRSGEVQAIRLRDYARRTKGEAAEYLVGGCTSFERKLLETQEVMTIRGKTGRPVPVILPSELAPGLQFLTNPDVRAAVGVSNYNTYVFAGPGESIVWAYDALRKVSEAANLKNPATITSTNLRKYMATVTQVLDLKDNQMQWVLNHLGHTMDVHKLHYRATSDILERTQIAKILLLQDQGRVGQFRNKCLDDVDLEDVVFPSRGEQNTEGADIDKEDNRPDLDLYDAELVLDSAGLTSPDIIQETLNEAKGFFAEDLEESKTIRKAPKNTVKCYWSQQEENEIEDLFKRFFDAKVRPKPSDCLKAIRNSKAKNGLICNRKKDVLKKKVYRMIDKLKVKDV